MSPSVDRHQLGDPADWVDRYGDGLLRYATARVAAREVAEDLVQETLLAAFRHREKFDGRCSAGTWLVAILKRRIADFYRHLARTAENGPPGPIAGEDAFTPRGKWVSAPRSWKMAPDRMAENAEFWQVFRTCLQALPPHLAQAFQMRELGQTSVDDICSLAEITAKNLAVRLHRARLLLRECLERKWFAADGEHS